mmetsp:Transcript_12628/g.28681  ORF Transcript_12628/g.28681 Transcript_12628/m.28681 type:complete len:679 (-) Transcript_12628:29-2065(-)
MATPKVAKGKKNGAAEGKKVVKGSSKKKASADEKEETAPTKVEEIEGGKDAKRSKAKAADAESSDALTGALALDKVAGLGEVSRGALEKRGFSTLLEVQHRAFEPIFSGKDTVGRAKTGCGKTLAFCLPVIERIVKDSLSTGKRGRKPLMLGLAPTRELAKQIFNEFLSVATCHKLTATCLYGGTPFGPQVEEVRAGVDAIIATPGRLLDHLKRQTFDLDNVQFAILDEADEMLSMGFQEDVEAIFSYVPANAQKMLFSATMPKWVETLIKKHLKADYVVVDVVGKGADNQANANITHKCISCSPKERGDTLADLCKAHAGEFGKTLVFAETKKDCDELAKHPTLVRMGAAVLHGDIPQTQREVAMDNFRSGKIKLLIATDVAARGLDVPSVDLVVMTRPPGDLDTYVHRSGRTARGGKTGTCVVFYARNEEYLIRLLQNKKKIPLKRCGPPQPCEVVAQAARDAVRQIDDIHQDNVDAFAKIAEELVAERGSPVFLLSAALAAMTGYTDRIKSRSLLTSFEGYVTIQMENERPLETTSKAWYLLRNNVPQKVSDAARAMSLVKGRLSAVFDCAQDDVQTILHAEPWKGIKFSQVEELPELEPDPRQQEISDESLHADWKKRKWSKIASNKYDESDQKRRRFDDDWGGGGKGKGGRGFKGKGESKGKGKGSGRGRGFA